MKCHNCSRKGIIFQHANRYLCGSCFSELFEKRIRKFTRINKTFKPKDSVLVHDSLSNFIIQSISKDMPLEIFAKKPKNKAINKEVIQWTADDEACSFISSVFNGKNPKIIFDKKKISILLPVSDNEAEIFASLHNLNFKPNKKNPEAQKFIEEIEKASPGIKHTLTNNIQLLNRLTSNVK